MKHLKSILIVCAMTLVPVLALAQHGPGDCVFVNGTCYTAPSKMSGPPVGMFTVSDDFYTPVGTGRINRDLNVGAWTVGSDNSIVDIIPSTFVAFGTNLVITANGTNDSNHATAIVWCIAPKVPSITMPFQAFCN